MTGGERQDFKLQVMEQGGGRASVWPSPPFLFNPNTRPSLGTGKKGRRQTEPLGSLPPGARVSGLGEPQAEPAVFMGAAVMAAAAASPPAEATRQAARAAQLCAATARPQSALLHVGVYLPELRPRLRARYAGGVEGGH